MKQYFIIAAAALSFAFTSCNNGASQQNQPAQEQPHHDGHDHAAGQQTAQPQTPPPAPVEQKEPVANIPDFKFYRLKSGFSYEKTDIPAGKNTVFILFDPSCGHCQTEAQALAKNYEKVKNINILYVSMNDPGLMAQFLPSFGKELDGKENVELLYDRDQNFIRNFHIPNIFPANYIYGADGKLKTYWEGDKHIDDIISAFTK